MSVELIKSEEELKREQALRELTKSFFGIEKPLKGCISHISTLNDLIRELHVAFSSDYINIELVNHLMMVYTSNYNDWKKYGECASRKLKINLGKYFFLSINSTFLAKFDRYR